jgi:hypothetical protein
MSGKHPKPWTIHDLLAAWSQRLLETGLRDFAGSKGMIGHHGWSFSHHEREVRVRAAYLHRRGWGATSHAQTCHSEPFHVNQAEESAPRLSADISL